MSDVILRDLNGMDEFRAAEALQREVWGKGDTADPADLMMVIQAEGGLCGGAFRGEELIGYVFGFPTRAPDVQHSHRLAVRAQARGLGLGARLKWYQRDWCRARGIRSVRWTFDPLRLPNASLNIDTLGAVGRSYLPDYYGRMAGINAGVPSDRLLVEWVLDAPEVAARADHRTLPVDAAARIPIPADFAEMLVADPARALAERLQLREALTKAFAGGLEITGFDRSRREYLLTHRAD